MTKRKNVSLKVPLEQVDRVKELLESEGLREREVKNTLWSYEGDEVYMNMYPSGTLLIQGKGAEAWADRILERIEVPEGPLAGCDEVGKGDLFGPLVLCCAVVSPENFKKVLSISPKDSKSMKDDELLKRAEKLKKYVNRRCIVLMPERFNELYREYGNINRLMDDAYRKLVQSIVRDFKPVRVVIDRYSFRNPFQDMGVVDFLEKGERDVVVSVASMLARAKFLEKLRELEDKYRLKLPKGASSEAKRLAQQLKIEDPELANALIKSSFNGG